MRSRRHSSIDFDAYARLRSWSQDEVFGHRRTVIMALLNIYQYYYFWKKHFIAPWKLFSFIMSSWWVLKFQTKLLNNVYCVQLSDHPGMRRRSSLFVYLTLFRLIINLSSIGRKIQIPLHKIYASHSAIFFKIQFFWRQTQLSSIFYARLFGRHIPWSLTQEHWKTDDKSCNAPQKFGKLRLTSLTAWKSGFVEPTCDVFKFNS